MGGLGIRVERARAFPAALAANGPAVIDVVTDNDALALVCWINFLRARPVSCWGAQSVNSVGTVEPGIPKGSHQASAMSAVASWAKIQSRLSGGGAGER